MVHKDQLLSDGFLNFAITVTQEAHQITCEVEGDLIEAVSQELSLNLKPQSFAQFKSEYETIIIFPNKIFKFAPKDATTKQKVIDYAQTLGIPEAQLAKI